MKGVIRKSCLAAALAALLGLGGCQESPSEVASQGGGSEAVALTGLVRNPNQTPVLGARVRVRPRLFLQDTAGASSPRDFVADTVTDDSGAFRMDSLETGEYYLEIRDAAGQGLVVPFAVNGLSPKVDIGAAVLKPTGSVSGSFQPPAGFRGRTWVQVYGLNRLVLADSTTGGFRLDSLPEGSYMLRALHSSPAVNPLDVGGVSSRPSLNTDIGALQLGAFELENYALWPRSMRITLNTTAQGANVPSLVTDFPLLVRLHAGNFDFSQARGDGRDVRFSDHRGKRLRYQVESWDSAGAKAEIWVRTDVIQGNSRDQFITVHWGNPAAMDWSDGRAVFERDYGFAGVWHMGEEAAGVGSEDLYADAVGINAGDDQVATTDKQGLIGRGASFGGADYIKVPVADPSLKPLNRLYLSAWFKTSKIQAEGGNLLSMGDNYNLRVSKTGYARVSLFDGTARLVEDNTQSVLDGAWHHMAGVFDGSAIILYLDGVEKGRLATSAPIHYNKSPHFILGVHGDGKPAYGFIGSMDEAVVSSEARSPEWIKLIFESQRTDSKLLEYLL